MLLEKIFKNKKKSLLYKNRKGKKQIPQYQGPVKVVLYLTWL